MISRLAAARANPPRVVIPDLIPLLGIKPLLGRNFQADDVPFNAHAPFT